MVGGRKTSACGVQGVKVPQREGWMVMWKQAGVINLGGMELGMG